MPTITNKILINNFNIETEYYFGDTNGSLISKSDTDEVLGSIPATQNVQTTFTTYIFKLNIKTADDMAVVKPEELKQYGIKNIIIYLVDGDISNSIDKNLIHNEEPPNFSINGTNYKHL